MAKCLYCGGVTEAKGGADADIDCPGCNQPMRKVDHDGVIIDECARCHGTWYDRGELQALVKAQIDAGASAEHSKSRNPAGEVAQFHVQDVGANYRKCPRCEQPMTRRNYEMLSGILIDVCPIHGTFLDEGEFRQMRVFVQTGGEDLADAERKTEGERLAEVREQGNRALEAATRARVGRLDHWWRRPYVGSGLLGMSMSALLHHLLDQ